MKHITLFVSPQIFASLGGQFGGWGWIPTLSRSFPSEKSYSPSRGEHGRPTVPETLLGRLFRTRGKRAAGTNVSKKSLRKDWRLEGQLKSQGKWLAVGGTFLWDFTYLCWNLTKKRTFYRLNYQRGKARRAGEPPPSRPYGPHPLPTERGTLVR
jgi:hypothetical protein